MSPVNTSTWDTAPPAPTLETKEIDLASVEPFATVTIGDVPHPGPIMFLVQNLWVKGAFGVVGALPKSWKSWLVYQLAIAVASGTDLFGQFKTQKGKVLIFPAEGGPSSARRRIGAICNALGIDIKTLDIEIIDIPVMHLDDIEQCAQFTKTVMARKPSLVILDPLREIHTGEENDSGYIAKLLGPLRTLQSTVGCAVMVVHHAGKPSLQQKDRRAAEQLRGSGAIAGAIDSGIFITCDGEAENKRANISVMHRDAPEIPSFTLKLTAKAGNVDDIFTEDALFLELVDDTEEAEQERMEKTVYANAKQEREIKQAINVADMHGNPLKSQTQILNVVHGNRDKTFRVIKDLVERGEILHVDGKYLPVPPSMPDAVLEERRKEELSDEARAALAARDLERRQIKLPVD